MLVPTQTNKLRNVRVQTIERLEARVWTGAGEGEFEIHALALHVNMFHIGTLHVRTFNLWTFNL